MNEDRRPNVAGKPLDEDEESPPASWSSDRIEREARSLKRRTGVDGHRAPAPAPENGSSEPSQ